MLFLFPLLACGQAPMATQLPGIPPDSATTARFAEIADELAALREVPTPAPVPIRVMNNEAWTLRRGQQAVFDSRDDHALALAGLGLIEGTNGLASRLAQRQEPVAWDPELGAILATAGGLEHPRTTLAVAHSLLPSCEPAAWTWDALRVADAIQEGMAVVLAWQLALRKAGLATRGLNIDPTLPLEPWRKIQREAPAALDADDDALMALGTDVVLRLLKAGDWRIVDKACDSPPSSTAALLHPERWVGAEGPAPVGPTHVPDWEQAGWRQVHNDRVGELGLATWLANTAQVATAAEARELAAGWEGDAVSVWQHAESSDLRAAWTVNLARAERKKLARLLHGQLLVDGRVVEVRPGPGGALVFLVGGSGDPIVTVLEAAKGGAVTVRLGPSIDPVSWEQTLRLQASPASTQDGVAHVGSLNLPLAQGWMERRHGIDGQVLSLRHSQARIYLDLYESPSLLVGPTTIAVERIARMIATQQGVDRPVEVSENGSCAMATVLGRDRNRNPIEIQVRAIPQADGVLITRARFQPRSVPSDYRRMMRNLETNCQGSVAQRTYFDRMDGQ